MRPYTILNSAMSLDGRIGITGEKIVLSNRLDEYRVHKLRGSVDAILVGINTVFTDNPKLTVRHLKAKNPVRIIVDSNAKTPPSANILSDEAKTIIAVSARANKKRVKRLKEISEAEVLVVGQSKVDLGRLMWRLYERGVRRILLEGGGTLNRSMLQAHLVDEIFVTIAPTLIGDGIDLIRGELDEWVDLSLEGIRQYGDQVVLHYRVKRK